MHAHSAARNFANSFHGQYFVQLGKIISYYYLITSSLFLKIPTYYILDLLDPLNKFFLVWLFAYCFSLKFEIFLPFNYTDQQIGCLFQLLYFKFTFVEYFKIIDIHKLNNF